MRTPYFDELRERIRSFGGLFNAHMHLDRAGTFHPTVSLLREAGVMDPSSLSLMRKHATIPSVHASECYNPDALLSRVEAYLHLMIEAGTVRADSLVDTTADRVGVSALEVFACLKARHAGQIDLRIGAYSPLGFRDDEPERWALLEAGAAIADFIGLLPERDDKADYPDHIGFLESCRRGIMLAQRSGKQIHIHVDQANHQHERGTELIVDLVEGMKSGIPRDAEPFIWLIHAISPSAYDAARFDRLASQLAALNIGVICCPAAALSMRQYRPLQSPTHNSIARILELVAAGVHVRLGSDNVCDITSPMGTVDLMDEVRVLGDTVRYYDIDFLAGLAAGRRIEGEVLARLTAHIEEDKSYVDAAVSRLSESAPISDVARHAGRAAVTRRDE